MKPHIWLHGLPYMVDRGIVSERNSNPFAPRLAGGEDYRDFSTWSMWVMSSWSTGVAKADPDAGGYLYGEGVDTRYPGILTLSPNVTSQSVDVATTSATSGIFSDDIDGEKFLALGNKLYKAVRVGQSITWSLVYTAPVTITSVSSFNAYVHMGQGDTNNYVWYDPSGGASGTGAIPARVLKEIGGFLYAAKNNMVTYTAGPVAASVAADPGNSAWVWEEWVKIGGSEGFITGIAGTINDSFNNQSIYISTDRALFMFLPFDVPLQLTRWYTADAHNGTIMSVYHNDVYVSEGYGLLRMTPDGTIVSTGLDLGIGLACTVSGRHGPTMATNNYVLSAVNPSNSDGAPTMWAWGGEGWSFMAKYAPGTDVLDTTYDIETGQVLAILSDGKVYSFFYLDSMSMYKRDTRCAYTQRGYIDTGSVFGGVREVEKDFHSIYFHGCIFPGTWVDVYYSNETYDAECQQCYDTDGVPWVYVGRFTGNNQELFFPPTKTLGRPVAKSMRFKIELITTVPGVSPVVNALRLKYIPKLNNAWSFRFSVTLPRDAIEDLDGEKFAEYSQAAWDDNLVCATDSAAPVRLIDIDGRAYYVAITDFSRMFSDVTCDGYDVHWTIGALQVLPNTTGETVTCG